jgi:Fur family peroxide stress response transcriptional regulator
MDAEKRQSAIIDKLRETGHKMTPQRLAIVRLLAESKGHPSVESIYTDLHVDFPTMSLATVYRNVMLIKSLGEVLELGFPDASNRYDGNRPYPHPHVICTRCKHIRDAELEDLTDMTEDVAKVTGFKILNHRMDFFGICPRCQTAAP